MASTSPRQSVFAPADPDKLERARQLRDELNRIMPKDRDQTGSGDLFFRAEILTCAPRAPG
jgi:hypothetical protein